MTVRSYLYVPGDQPDKLAKALTIGADAVIADLEDSVAPAAKDKAREIVAGWLAGLGLADAEVWVRVNPGEGRERDVRSVIGEDAARSGITGLCVAKTETAAELAELDQLLSSLGSPASVSPLLESAGAVLRAPEIAQAPRVSRLQVGEADLCADIGASPGPDDRELLFVRSQVVLASAAAGIGAPVGPVSTDFRDLDALRESTLALKRLGYRGRACIHPAQVAVVNDAFTPSPEEVSRAETVVRRFEEAAGSGVILDDRGRMVDEAVIRQARHVLMAARAARGRHRGEGANGPS